MFRKLLLVGFLLILFIAGLAYFGLNARTEQSTELLRSNPVIVQHLGGIDSSSVELVRTAKVAGDGLVLSLIGPNAQGIVVLDLDIPEMDVEGFKSGSLELESGESFDLFPDAP